jgi:ABC-type nitrate/sulfonate/bicarbonate transport system substrate-binding protein
MKTKDKPVLRLPRREFLKRGGMGVLGTFIAASTLGSVAGVQRASADNVMANLKSIKMGDWNPNYASQWSYRLAQALGYLKEVGIDDFEVILSDEYIPGLVGGSLDITHSDTDVLFGAGAASELPMKAISIYRHKEWHIMGVRPGIETAEDLKGAKVSGGPLEGRNTYIQRQIVVELGLDPEKDVEFVPMKGGSDGRLQALLAGTIDAGSLFPRHRFGLEEAGGKFIYEELTDTPQECFGVMGEWLDKNQDTAYAYCYADIKARQWLFDPANKEKAYQTMIDLGYEIPPEFVELYKVELDQISPDGGFESAEAMDEFVKILQKTGDLPEGIDWRNYVDMTYVWAAQDALGLPRRPASL